jgi:AcrR family transcriptional regulator
MSSREKILEAAIKVFAEKGRHGARMEHIAAAAGLNKAMVYYIFHNRDELYHEVIKTIMIEVNITTVKEIESDLKDGIPVDRILVHMIERDFDTFLERQSQIKIVIEAMTNEREALRKAIMLIDQRLIERKRTVIFALIDKGKEEGIFRDIDTDELFGNIAGMNLIYFLTNSIGDLFGIDTQNPGYLERRKQSIIDLVLYGVLSRK